MGFLWERNVNESSCFGLVFFLSFSCSSHRVSYRAFLIEEAALGEERKLCRSQSRQEENVFNQKERKKKRIRVAKFFWQPAKKKQRDYGCVSGWNVWCVFIVSFTSMCVNVLYLCFFVSAVVARWAQRKKRQKKNHI